MTPDLPSPALTPDPPADRGVLVRCPVCGNTADEFLPFAGKGSTRQRPNAKCPHCGSLERHRLVWLYFLNETDLFTGTERKRMLHIAPEVALHRHLSREPLIDYLSVDLDSALADEKMDITDIAYPANTFDVIYCSHVLEHIPEDRSAMAELCRVLRPGGWAILQVPILRERTVEAPSVTDPEERRRKFGQVDHVRAYGPDYADRLREVGFIVQPDDYPKRLGPVRTRRYGLMARETVFYCTKP